MEPDSGIRQCCLRAPVVYVMMLLVTGGMLSASRIAAAQGGGMGSLEDDWRALIALYNSTDGDNWTNNENWSTSTDAVPTAEELGGWRGVTVTNGRVTRLRLRVNNLSGVLPDGLGSLSELTSLEMGSNTLSGTIPATLGNLTKLTVLELSFNELTGTIPATLANLTQLSSLNLGINSLKGSIPGELGRLSKLESLSLGSNDLTGAIPAELGDLSRLGSLTLLGNSLSGGIPSELGRLTNLTHLHLSNNELTGPIPGALGSLEKLEILWLEGNELTGALPSELAGLTSLEVILANRNNLSGSIPSWLGAITTLTSLWLHSNEFSGPVPDELGNLANLSGLYLYDNKLTGELPSSLTNISGMQLLWWGGQELCAPVTPSFQAWLASIPSTNGPNCVGEPEVIVEPAVLLVMEGDPQGDSFNVRLATEPTADVTLTITGYAGTDLTVSPPSLAFTADTWETDQSVNVTAAHDDNRVDETISLELQASGGDYEDKTAEVVVTILDDDQAPVLGIRNAAPVTEGEVASFAVELTAASSQEVTVTYSTGRAGDTAEGGSDYAAALGQTLSITAGDLSAVIPVQTHDDAVFEGPESFTVTLVGVSGGAMLPDEPHAAGTILDDESAPTIDIDAAPKMVAEHAGSVLVSVRLSVASDALVKVRLATTEGTATAGADYGARSLEVVFASGETEESVSIAIVDDDLVEGDETFGVRLSAPTIGEIGREEVAVTILDNDTHSELAIGRGVVVPEGAGRARFTVSLHPVRSTEVRVDYATADVTATAGADYNAASGTLVFEPGATQRTVDVTIVDDALVEPSETFRLNLDGADGDAVIVDSTATGTIIDDDGTSALVVRNAAPVTEGEVASFAVELTAASSQDVTVTYSTGRVGDTAEGGSDYEAALGQTLSITAGDLSAVIPVQTHDDAVFEGPESFTVTLVGVSGGAMLPDDPYATGTILDDESAPTIDIDAGPKMVAEHAGSVLVSVRLSVASDALVKVRLATTEGTATAGADYVARSLEVVFASGETEESVSIGIVDDDLVEGDETFGVRLSAPTNGEIGHEEVAVTILDNDTHSELAIGRGVVVPEGAGRARFTVSLHPVRSTEVRVDYATADVTATAGADYNAASGTLVFEPGATQRTVDVTIVDDALVEPSETFRLNLDGANGDAVIVESTATGTIIDDDGTSALVVANLSVHEDAGTANVRVVLSPASDADVTVRYATSDGTATAGEDYGSTSDILAIPAGETEQVVSVGILDDLAVESSETFMVTLSDASNADISLAAATVTIIDDDEQVLSIDDVVVDEDAGEVVFTARLDVPFVLPVRVQYASVDGTATAGLDYVVASGVLAIPPGDLHGEIRVMVIDDALTEGDETFTVVLSRATNAALGDATGEAVIRDNDTYSLSVDDVTVSEADAEASFTVSLDRVNPAQTVSVQYATSDATAAAGRDYEARSGTLEIDSGQLRGTISVPILDDAEREGQETFFLSLSGAQNAEIADDEGTGTIVDDDEPALGIEGVRAWEGAGMMMFVVTLDGESAEEVSVGYQTREGTATEGVDYERAAGRLRFESAEVSKTIAVRLVDDAIDEPDETFVMQLSDPEGAAIAAGEAAGTILDDDAPPVLGVVSATTVGEGEGTAEFAVTLSRESALEVKASYATSDGTATAGEDYTGARGMLTIGPGETTGKVAVPILDDNVQETNETFVLTLSGVQGATPGNSTSTATIVDNEVVPVLTIDDVTAAEDAGAAVFVVRLSGTTSLAVSVRYATSDETATAGGDYTETQGTLRFGATEVEKEIRVPVVADNLDEEDETFLVTLSGAENAVIGDGVGRGTIMHNDEPVTISIHDGRATEDAGILHLLVRLSRASPRVVSVFFETSDATAEAGSDYTASRGITIFERGSSEGVVAIAILDDALDEESEEAFQVRLSRPTNAVIVRGVGTGTIEDDDGMPLLRVDDIMASEDGGEAVFVVWLSSPSERMVTVQYRTLDGTAEAGADYVMAAGTLVFAPGDVEEEVRVRLLRDGVDWRSETFSLALESATNVLLEDAVAVATIVEEESVEEGVLEAYLARMLRTSASHVVEAMGERMRWQQRDASCRSIAHRGLGMMRQVNPDWGPSAAELLSGCGLATRAEAGRGAMSVWGRGAFTRVDGQEGALSLSANVTTAALGADYQWRSGLSAGLVLARSHGAGTFEAYADEGETGSVLTGAYPYVSYRLRATNMWVMAGLGRGAAEVAGSESVEAQLTSDLVAAGAVGRLVGGSRARLSYEADVFLARVRTEEMVEVGVRRLRAGLEASMTVSRSVRGYIEAGLRHDGGDAETGLGLEVGGGLRLARPGSRLRAELSSRGLVSHAASGFAEWGVAGALRYGAQGGLGPTAEIRPIWGPARSGGWQALWRHDTVLDAMAGVPGELHMEVELGYGTRLVVGEGVARPTLAVAVAERGKDYRLGYEVRPRRGLGVSVSGVARESVLPYLPVTYGISVRAAMQW